MNEEGVKIFKSGLRTELTEASRIAHGPYSESEKIALLEEVMCRIFDDLDATEYKLILMGTNDPSSAKIVETVERLERISPQILGPNPQSTAIRDTALVAQRYLETL
jgi:hypothetical protein